MVNKKRFVAFLMVATLCVTNVFAQYSIGNNFSPYTMYGIGEMFVPGDAASKSMGGIGLASRSRISPNAQNPAAFSAMIEKSALFSVGIQANNNFLSDKGLSSSHNNLQLSNVNLQFRVAKGIGFGFSLSPYSNSGYRVKIQETDPEIISSVGDVAYNHYGKGGISNMKFGFGFALTNNLSIGVNYMYMLGTIDRKYVSQINPYISPYDYRSIYDEKSLLVNQSTFELGAQYRFKIEESKSITIGAVYQPSFKTKAPVTHFVESSYGKIVDTIRYAKYKTSVKCPSKYAIGFLYTTPKIRMGLDYVYRNFDNLMPDYVETDRVTYAGSHDVKFGLEYIPNRFDIRSNLKRWTYRLGAKYSRSYYRYDNKPLDEIAVTLGFGVPLQKNGFTQLNIGAEVGRQGLETGQISNTYFKVFGGVNFVSIGSWFKRRKFK
ncbi:MAG: hypothetical protein IMY73_01680 [Bacteroidetes bacterium]|nr:hypothetical protein [Bacteroidota bacterium]